MIIKPEFKQNGILEEYPRPQLKRDSYLCLNGEWDYAITDSAERPEIYDGKIVVPYSPESALSGVNRQLKKDEYLHYRTFFAIPDGFFKGRLLLNIGACDQVCEIFINGLRAAKHEGGYLPFTVDITRYLSDGENELAVLVIDDADSDVYGRGKQAYKRGGIWYTAISGIWQSVWLESVPEKYISAIKLTPCYKTCTLTALCQSDESLEYTIKIYDGDSLITEGAGATNVQTDIDVSACKTWSPDCPELYRIEIITEQETIESYFGLRDFGAEKVKSYKLFCINGKPVFLNGLLDQGYWGEGIYTPESNAKMYDVLREVKALGFNMLRKHIKIEPLLWYYYCDILGIVVWQDMVNGGKAYKQSRINLGPFINLHLNDGDYRSMGRDNPLSRRQYIAEAEGTITALYNQTGIFLWTPFNEGWGQFDAVETCAHLAEMDNTRLFDHASGWQDMGAGDVYSRHIYFKKLRLKNDKKRVLAVTEFGGYAYGENAGKHTFGYKKITSKEKLLKNYKKLYFNEVIPHILLRGLCATVYTQLNDVEDEINGIFTADFKLKIDRDSLIAINRAITETFNDTIK